MEERTARTASHVDRALLDLALTAARAASAELLARRSAPLLTGVKSSPTDAVTNADLESEAAITTALIAGRPDDAIRGEEGTNRAGTSDIAWVVDPLDGTVNYLFGDPEWSVSIAAVDRHGPRVAVVADPARDRCYSAIRGRGAWLNQDQRLLCRTTTDLGQALVLMGLDYRAKRRHQQLLEFGDLIGQIRDVRRHGSAALELCRVAEGTADAYLEAPIKEWDIAAGTLIAQEAGADVQIEVLGDTDRAVAASVPGITTALASTLRTAPHAAASYGFVADLSAAAPAAGTSRQP